MEYIIQETKTDHSVIEKQYGTCYTGSKNTDHSVIRKNMEHFILD